MEPVGCLDRAAAAVQGHFNGDSDQTPSDSHKSYPHHHGVCRGHQIGEVSLRSGIPAAFAIDVPAPSVPAREMRSAVLATAVRPPRV